ncbi:hypothetical protein H4582DRAFT_1123688 [Lactarius indigo]|nr:hypothetical protein H4582DRAFT_1123688 [Lactarius indigo]
MLILATKCLFCSESSPDVKFTPDVLVWARERAARVQPAVPVERFTMSHVVSGDQMCSHTFLRRSSLPLRLFRVVTSCGDNTTHVIHHLRTRVGPCHSRSPLTKVKFAGPLVTKTDCIRQLSIDYSSSPIPLLPSRFSQHSARRRSPVIRRAIPCQDSAYITNYSIQRI